MVRYAALGLLILACRSSTEDQAHVPDGDSVIFGAEVQPVLEGYCAFLGCHGREGMPLALYAVDYLRLRDPEGLLDPARPKLDEQALAEAELAHNRRSLAARVDDADPYETTLVRLLLPPEEGGLPHASVVVFEHRNYPELEALTRWVATVSVSR
ncbi:MAG: hypothetical protein AABZ30_02795 [Myxococcota bacterium]